MQYQEYVQRVQQTSQLIQEARNKGAVEALYQEILSDISEIDKADMCVNLAVVYDRMGNNDEVKVWNEKGVFYEQNSCRFDVAEKKAQYLSQLGLSNQVVPIHESLMKQLFVS